MLQKHVLKDDRKNWNSHYIVLVKPQFQSEFQNCCCSFKNIHFNHKMDTYSEGKKWQFSLWKQSAKTEFPKLSCFKNKRRGGDGIVVCERARSMHACSYICASSMHTHPPFAQMEHTCTRLPTDCSHKGGCTCTLAHRFHGPVANTSRPTSGLRLHG